MWDLLRQGELRQYIFHRQKPIGNYILDFYCTKLLLVIEVDGYGHADREQKEYDKQRTLSLQEHNIYVLRFWNHEVLDNSEGVYTNIYQWIISKND
jgi:very-short-patch-repair endonuclease